jgi:prophage antirepressor-like protein
MLAAPTKEKAVSSIVPFFFNNQQVRVVNAEDGSPWFVASDIAKVLDYRMASDMTRAIEVEDKGTRVVRTPSGDQQMTVINESGVYTAIFGSRKPEAKAFKRWVTSEVLPNIRRTGQYGGFNVPATYAGALRLAAEQTDKLEAAEKKIQEQQPKVEFVDRYVDDNEFRISIRELAKLLCMGERDCVAFLIGSSVLYRNQRKVLLPHFRQVELRHAAVKTYVDGRICGHQTFFSRKGHLYVAGLLEDSYRKFALESPR